MTSQDMINENMSAFIPIASLLGLLAIPKVLSAGEILNNIPPSKTVSVSVDAFRTAITKADKSGRVGEYSKAQAINIIARTVYSEARNQKHIGRLAIMSVIWNRAGGKLENLATVCFARKQFSGWNKAHPSSNPAYMGNAYKITVPSTVFVKGTNKKIRAEEKVWLDSLEIATSVVTSGKFESIIGRRNMIINRLLDNKQALDSWGKTNPDNIIIGDHEFSYDEHHDGFKGK